MQSVTSARSRPCSGITFGTWFPTPTKIASKPWAFRAAIDSTRVEVRISTPRAVMFRMSRSSTSCGMR